MDIFKLLVGIVKDVTAENTRPQQQTNRKAITFSSRDLASEEK